MTSSTVTLAGWMVTVIVPPAGVLIPLSLKLKALGVGDGVGLGLVAGAEGEDEAVLPVPPQAAATTPTAAIASHIFKSAEFPQFCSKRYPSRLLDRPRPSARLDVLGATPTRPAGATPDQVAESENDQDGTDRAHERDHVVDRGDEVVRGVGEGCREAPVVRWSGGHGRTGFGQRDGDGAESDVVFDVLDLALELLDLAGDLTDLVLDGDDVGDVLRLPEQGEHRVALRLFVGEPRLEVDVLGADVLTADVLGLHLAQVRDRVDGRVEIARRHHEADDPRAYPVVGGRVRLRICPGDVAVLDLHDRAHRCQAGVE